MPTGIFVSRCSGRVDQAVALDTCLSDARRTATVVRVFDDLFDPVAVQQMVDDVAQYQLDAVVLAGNSHEHYVRSVSAHYLPDALTAAGVNPNRIVAANILEQVALAHPGDLDGATAKAAALIDVATRRAELARPIETLEIAPSRSVLILGITSEAAIAAQRLLRLGFSVVMADRGTSEQRGNPDLMRATSGFVSGHPAAHVVFEAVLSDAHGWLGDYEVTLEMPTGPETHRVGGILLARPDDAEWVNELRRHFKVDIDEDGYARSIDPATHPAETVEPGIMVVPLRTAESLTRDKVAAADAAAMALVLRLGTATVTRHRAMSAVDEELCGGCASCVRTCAFGACTLDEDQLSRVDERRCRACGKCVVGCPVGARDIVNSPHDYLMDAVRTLAVAPVDGPRVLGFLCGGCGYPAADAASHVVVEHGSGYPASFLPVRIPCGGRLDTLYVLEAFKSGFDAVCVYRCREGHCHNLIGNLDMDRRINLLRTVLRSRGLDDARLRIVDIAPTEGEHFIDSVEQVFAMVAGLTNGKGGAL